MIDFSITNTLAEFITKQDYASLPEDVIHETKRGVLDILGCALGSLELDKGKIGVEFAGRSGGKSEATILGNGEKTSIPMAAFANGELMDAMDYDALLPPAHVAPFVTSAVLAMAETRKASGKDFITAVVLAHDISSRIGISLGSHSTFSQGILRSFGFGCNVFGAASGAASIMKLDSEKTADALGLAGYFAPVPVRQKFMYTPNNGLQKYGPAGWTNQAGVTAAILAEMGERGDRSVLDGDYGFWAMNGSSSCNWDAMTKNLGKDWMILQSKYKCWPCDGQFQSPLSAFIKIIEDNSLKPEEIEQVIVKTERTGGVPQFLKTEVYNHVDAQFSLFFNIAVAAHRVKLGPLWQARSTVENPSIRALMKKVKWEEYSRAEEMRHQELEVEHKSYLNSRPSYVEVKARGKVFTQTAEYAKWLSTETPGYRATDEDLINKFRANAENVLNARKIREAIDIIMNLEKVSDMNDMITTLVS